MKILTIAVLTLVTALEIDAQNSRHEALINYLTNAEKFGYSGQVLIEQDGEILVNKALGYLSDNSSEKVTEETLFGIASVTKQFTAAAICLLAQNKKLNFDDKISTFFPKLPQDKGEITIHHLLTHTSGIQGGDVIHDFENISKEDMINRILTLDLDQKPGKKWRYSNSGYSLLAFIIERVSGLSYEEYLTENIFKPLGMNHTRIIGGSNSWNGLVAASALRGSVNVGTPREWRYNMRTIGGGNLASTASDLYKWNSALNDHNLLTKKYVEKLFHPHVQVNKKEYYGYGWFVFIGDDGKVRLIEHGGDYEKGFNAGFYKYQNKDLTIIILNNQYDPIGPNLWLRWAIFYPIRDILIKDLSELDYSIPSILRLDNDSIIGSYISKDKSSQMDVTKSTNGYSIRLEGLDVAYEIFQVPDSIKSISQIGLNRTIALVNELVSGNLEAYKDVIERPDHWNLFADEWDDIKKVYGEIMSFKTIAVVPNYYNDGVKCIIKLIHERGTSIITYAWMDYGRDKLYATYPTNELKLVKRIQKLEDGVWLTYDLFKNKWLEIKINETSRKIEIGSLVLYKTDLNHY